MSRQNLREGALARAVRSHDRVNLADLNGEIDSLEYFLVAMAAWRFLISSN